MDTTLKVLIADDHPLMLQAIRRTLEASEGIEVVGEAHTGEEMLALVARRKPQLVLLDLHMPGLNGIECISELARSWPGVKAVVFSASEDRASIDGALLAGASAYILKSVMPVDIPTILRQASTGAVYHAPSAPAVSRDVQEPSSRADLTPRETTILACRRQRPDDEGDQRGAVAQRAHGQVSPDQHLPQARRLEPQRRGALRLRERPRLLRRARRRLKLLARRRGPAAVPVEFSRLRRGADELAAIDERLPPLERD